MAFTPQRSEGVLAGGGTSQYAPLHKNKHHRTSEILPARQQMSSGTEASRKLPGTSLRSMGHSLRSTVASLKITGMALNITGTELNITGTARKLSGRARNITGTARRSSEEE